MLHPDYNDYRFPDLTLKIVGQMTRLPQNVTSAMPKNIRWKNGTHVLHTAGAFDEMTSMHLEREPVSELAAVRFLRKHTDHFPAAFVTALTQSIHILPGGRCVEFSNGQKGIVITENQKNYAQPVVMKTMDVRLKADRDTLKQYATDPHTREATVRYITKRKKLAAAGRI